MTNPVTPEFESALHAALPANVFRPLEARYLEEPRGLFSTDDCLLLAPGTPEETSQIVRLANAYGVAVIPYAGGTGLVGGQVPQGLARPILLSMERMTAIRSIHSGDNVIVAEAGVILSDVQQAAQDIGRLFPLSLAAEGSARIGGVLGTNAGGVNVLRYGNARDLCLGIEAVLPDGSIMSGLKRLRKDNTGYDLRNLLIGSEGTLGVITAASLRLFPRPAANGAAVMVVENPDAALRLLAMSQERLGEGVSAFELIHRTGPEFLSEVMPHVRQPFNVIPEWMVLIDLGLSAGVSPDAALENLFADAFEAGFVRDGVIARSEAQRREFWSMREAIPEANRHVGSISSHDISVPVSVVPEFIERAWEIVSRLGTYRINCFGHVGDGNLHFNVFPPRGHSAREFRDRREAIKTAVHDLVQSLEGSVSAEHGIGRLKVADLERYADPVRLAAMRAIKAVLDPAGIMNPGAVLR